MCGIVGMIRTSERPLPPPGTLGRMAAAIAHRGPDDAGELHGDDLRLGAVRLSIIDLDGGHQPAHGCAPAIAVVYNGEIYNHAELRRGLVERGHAIADRCDTSVLPHLYEEAGDELVAQLRGMFAFALWDGRARRLLLARDRLGIKPLFYVETADVLLFASEVKALFAAGLVARAIDRDSLDDLFSLSYPCPPRTMFAGVRELRPGHLLSVTAGQPAGAPRRYWRAAFPRRGEHRRGRRRDLEAELRALLLATVGDHLMSDVPLASYLSGGLDSSAIAALARAAAGAPPETLSIAFDEPRFDESEHARVMAEALGGPLHTVRADAAAAELLPAMIWSLELPLMVPGALGGLLLSAEARRRGLKVVLTGDGADEIMGGYDCFRGAALRRAFDRPLARWLRPFAYRRLYQWAGLPDGAVELMLEVQARPARDIEHAFGGLYPPWYDIWQLLDVERDRLLGVDGRTVRPATAAPRELAALVRQDAAAMHPLDAALAFELESRLPSWILVISDRSAMWNGVEARVPFLDHRVVDFVAALPPSLKMRFAQEKAILRGAMRGLLPEPIRRRRKQPFVTPVKEWFFSPRAPAWVGEALSDEAVRAAGLFDPAVVGALRRRLDAVDERHIDRVRLELVLMLVLGTQLLERQFVAGSMRP
jgi:asparagine synthase (glutamine-hydrolysing)